MGHRDGTSGGLGAVTLENLGTIAGGVPVHQVAAPRYSAAKYTRPASTGRVGVDAPYTAHDGDTVTVKAT